MIECSSCGVQLPPHKTHCPLCGKPTAYYHRQRHCLHCGTPAAEKTTTCMMCGRPVDSLPLSRSIFSGSWIGIGLGVLIIVGLVMGVNRFQAPADGSARAAGQARQPATPTPTITLTPTATGTPLPTPTFTATPTPTPRSHLVQSGETLLYIASQYGVLLEDLTALNNIDNSQVLRVGQELLIPFTAGADAEPTKLPSQIVYVIEPGDTLLGIALDFGTTVDAIVAYNPETNLDLIYPGQELVVPLATPTPTPTPTATLTPTATPGPPYAPPALLSPADGQVVTGSTLLFNWTATGLLGPDEYYVLQLAWPGGAYLEHWTRTNSWQISQARRPANGPLTWTVAIMRQTGLDASGTPTGLILTPPNKPHTVEWP